MVTIRSMHPDDADAVRAVDLTAFNVWWQQLRGESTSLAPRTRENVLYRLDRDPAGCFVAEEEGRVVGLIFSCTWGRVSWFGTFAVLPAYQGQGIGKRLLAASLEYLRQDRERLVGLETMPESAYNVGLYLREGFQPRLLTLFVTRPQQPAGQDAVQLPRWSLADAATRTRWLADLREASGGVYPGLDYSKEIILTGQHGMGETLLLTAGDQAVGMAIVVLASQREGWGDERATLHVLALHPGHTSAETFHTLLSAGESLAAAHGKREMVVPVSSGHAWALEQLLQWGYRVERTMVRMVLPETERELVTDRRVELSRWAG
jgi:ribosomal protein S18 acetylase RimI-like enzyme